jgi:hypothetical protein
LSRNFRLASGITLILFGLLFLAGCHHAQTTSCRDGSTTSSRGPGACSHHGGVA